MVLRASLLGLALALALPVGALAQEARAPVQSLIVTLDQERLFLRSAYGQGLLDEVEEQAAALAAENRRIEAELTAEEKQLTEDRPGMAPEKFRELSAAFDEKVVGIRDAQDAKARELVREREEVQQRFYQEVLPVLTEVVRERGAVVVLESRSVVLSAGQIDVTAEVIARIDAQFAPQAGAAEAPAGTGNGTEGAPEAPAAPRP
ncbi:OmpH family outer membrane protein [Actibacterium sp. MT2.3-13A]|uniref:OmpH family outer membrane protein n=1 Tax=Actibacterium sp. MT2.3-13A TaxID=2828332 RepID=UPI001BAC1531|nr:OmpH family outer membrane protein [Actibacterium sp. MT2.3-13A]